MQVNAVGTPLRIASSLSYNAKIYKNNMKEYEIICTRDSDVSNAILSALTKRGIEADVSSGEHDRYPVITSQIKHFN